MSVQQIKLNGVSFAVELSGPKSAPVVCLSHCFAADHRFWDSHLPAFDGLRVLRYDTRGHGASELPTGACSLAIMADDVVALLDVLGIDSAHFCGVSMGGMIGQTLAIAHPSRLQKLVLANTTARYSQAQRQLWRTRAALVERKGHAALHNELLCRWFSPHAIQTGIGGYHYMRAALERFPSSSFVTVANAISAVDTIARLGKVRAPTLVMASAADPGISAQASKRIAQAIPGAQLIWLPHSHHLGTLEHPAFFNDRVNSFLCGRPCKGRGR